MSKHSTNGQAARQGVLAFGDTDAPPVLETGVYCVLHRESGKRYIGSSATSLGKRWRGHRGSLRSGRHPNRYLQAAWNKHGEVAFEFIILERVSPEECIGREQYWLDYYKAACRKYGYNLCPTAGNQLGFKCSEETKRKLSAHFTGKKLSVEHVANVKAALQRPEVRAKLKLINLGRKASPELRKKLSEGRMGHPTSLETKAKLSAAHTGKKLSAEHIEKMAASKRGVKQSAETIAKRRASCESPEVKAKITAKLKGRKLTAEHRAKISAWNKGRRHSVDTLIRMSKAQKGLVKSAEHRAKLAAASKHWWIKHRKETANGQ